MPERIIRPGIIHSDTINALSWPEEVFYRRLMSVVDDYGRFDGRISMLRANLYPVKLDHVSDSDVRKWLAGCVSADAVRIYFVDGREYVEVLKFDQRLRGKPKWPEPPELAADCGESRRIAASRGETPPSSYAISETESETDEYSGESGVPAAPPESDGPSIMTFQCDGKQKEWNLTQKIVDDLRSAFPHIDIVQECHKSRGWCLANPEKRKTAKGMHKFLFGWMDRAQNNLSRVNIQNGIPARKGVAVREDN